jgi:hypothetical protein
MFIKEIKKRNKGYEKEFISHRLMESYRTQRGPRQRTVLNLGILDLSKEQWKSLADRIEAKVLGQGSLFAVDDHIEGLATHYAELIIQRDLVISPDVEKDKGEPDYETIDIRSVSSSRSRTIGAEYVGISMFKKLGLDSLFKKLGFTKTQIDYAVLSIVGRLVYPASERRMRVWATHLTGMDELLRADFSHISNNALYRILDMQLSHKDTIEEHLRRKEQYLFSLKENIILYDLTNTYFEGSARGNKKAKRGRSKEKRRDCPLVTLGMVINECGFPKKSEIFNGNVSEPGTLKKMIEALQGGTREKEEIEKGSSIKKKKGITVVMDAGIASEDNLSFLKDEGYDYICVARNTPVDASEINEENLLTIKVDKNNKVEAQLITRENERILYCKSLMKGKKEQAMKTLFQQRFEQGLKEIEASFSKKGGTKRYEKVIERIGRLKEKYSSIAHYYKLEVEQHDGKATSLHWEFDKGEKSHERFSGTYFLRTSRCDLNEKEIWSLYVMLTHVEDAFRYLKSDLNLRPVWHQKEDRVDAHVFNTLLAYHLLVSIQTQLRCSGITMRWRHVRDLLKSHVRITTGMTNKEGKRIYIRKCSDPEPFHKKIYNALNLTYCPIGEKRIAI